MDEEAFLAAIKAHPDDTRTRLVYADWLDENGRPDAAEYIRLQHEHRAIAARLDELSRTMDGDWLLKLDWRCDVVVRAYPPAHKITVIKLVRELTSMGLAEAKAFVEQPLPICLARGLLPERALKLQSRLAPYATVTIEPPLPPAGDGASAVDGVSG